MISAVQLNSGSRSAADSRENPTLLWPQPCPNLEGILPSCAVSGPNSRGKMDILLDEAKSAAHTVSLQPREVHCRGTHPRVALPTRRMFFEHGSQENDFAFKES